MATFMKTCRENAGLIKKGKKYETLYMKSKALIVFSGHSKPPEQLCLPANWYIAS
jgi:hypothetical protein